MNHKNHSNDYCRQGCRLSSSTSSSSRVSNCAEIILRKPPTGIALSLFLVTVVAIFFAAPAAAVSFDVQVSAGADDAEENSTGSVLLTSSDLELVFDRDSNQTVGMRFNGVNVPAGATIQSAYIQFTVDEKTTVDTSLTIEGDAADNAAPFIRSSFNLSSRSRTSANVGWTPPPWQTSGAAGLEQRTPNIASIIQEIVGRPGWSANNSLALLVTGIGERVAESFNGVPSSAPRLHIEYSGDAVNLPPQVDAGADSSVTLPNVVVSLDGTVTDDNLPIGTLITTSWSHVGGTGNGVVSFGNPVSVDTTATFTTDPGTYILRLSADDSVLSSFDEVTITVNSDAAQALDRQVVSTSDDAEERADGNVSLTSSDLELVYDRDGNQTVGMRFNEIDISPGASVINAYIQFTVDEAQTQAVALIIEGEASVNASTFADVSFNISSRLRTVANQPWDPNGWPTVGQAGVDQRTPNIASIIQEIIDFPGWSSGNSLALLITGNGERIAESFNGVSAAAPRLHIEFAGSTSNQPPQADAGADSSVTLPNVVVSLDGTVTDDNLPIGTLITTSWSHVGGTGNGAVSFGNPGSVDTTATFTTDPGTYILRLSADDSVLSSFDEVTITVNSDAAQALDRQVVSSSDDAEERADGNVSLTSSDLELVYDRDGNQTVGMRFNEIDISPGASVINAYIQFTVDEAQTQAVALIIEGEASVNASTFADVSFNISSRLRTVANQPWDPNGWPTVGQAGVDQRTPNIASIIQEIIDFPGWSSGNSLALLITGNGERIAESFNGVSAVAPRLHIEFAGSTSNQPPSVNAGADTSLTLPNDTVPLDGTISDDGLPGAGVITVWSHVGGTGSGVVTFGDPSAIDTTATITPDLGTYVLRLSANDGELSSVDELMVSVREEATGGEVTALRQVNNFATGFGSNGIPLTIPSIDPAGIVYYEPSGRLFIADSEINEVSQAFDIVGGNLFETSASGSSLFDQWNLTLRTGNEPFLNREPTGIAYCGGDGHFYVSNDDLDLVYRYAYDGTTFTAVDAVSTRPNGSDPEGITCDPVSGRLYVIDGTGIDILVYRYDSGFVLEDVLHLPTTAGTSAGVPGNPEGIAFDPVSGHLFLVQIRIALYLNTAVLACS